MQYIYIYIYLSYYFLSLDCCSKYAGIEFEDQSSFKDDGMIFFFLLNMIFEWTYLTFLILHIIFF